MKFENLFLYFSLIYTVHLLNNQFNVFYHAFHYSGDYTQLFLYF